MRVLDLFAGIGGFSLAAHWMGWETVAFCEKEPFCQKVLRKNFGDVPIYDDVRTFPGKSFRGRVDIITGGFPCQPFSQAGKREGRDDERHLFPAMLEIVRDVRPLWVVAENVRGLLSIESGLVFEEVVTSLEGEGYEVVAFCVPASAVDAPHRRDRLWAIAHANQHGESALSVNGRERCGQLGAIRAGVSGNTTGTRLPDWAAGTLGQPKPITEFERPSGREIERDFCGVPYGVSSRVDRLKSLGNAIVPQVAFEIFKAIEETL